MKYNYYEDSFINESFQIYNLETRNLREIFELNGSQIIKWENRKNKKIESPMNENKFMDFILSQV